jgi:hypothetical protein
MLTRLAPRRTSARAQRDITDLTAFCIVERRDGSSTWIRCGQARLNRDGSINVRLDALPLNGELHLRPTEDSGQAVQPAAPVPEPAPSALSG